MRTRPLLVLAWIAFAIGLSTPGISQVVPLDAELLAESTSDLAADARELGDATKGALLFHSPSLGCAKCHATAQSADLLGPDLAHWNRPVDNVHLIESVLKPSSKIEPAYQGRQVILADGNSISGIEVTRDDRQLILRTGTGDGDRVSLPLDEIEAERIVDVSLMPAGQVNGLRSRQDFLDLIAYLVAIRDGGREAAMRLQPSEEALRLRIPPYEFDLDHRGLIADWDADSLERGEAIYQRVCQNCHGTLQQPGSLPTSLRFAEGAFKFGKDPFSLYQTLTHGAGMMTPQTWMVPEQKYDVIHFIRETFLREHNRSQYTEINEAYLTGLPRGTTRGPEPQTIEPWNTMDYGSLLITTIQFGDGPENIAQKAIAIRVDEGDGGIARGNTWIAFEHDTLRMAAAWTGEFVDWNGIQFDGQHGVHLRATGEILAETFTGPGWANPADGSLTDNQRVIGRDERRYGPLPTTWAKYRGLYRYGNHVILDYTVGSTSIQDRPSFFTSGDGKFVVRSLNVGQRSGPLEMVVMDVDKQAVVERVALDDHDTTWIVRRGNKQTVVALDGFDGSAELTQRDDHIVLSLPAGETLLRGSVAIGDGDWNDDARRDLRQHIVRLGEDLQPLMQGGPAQFPLTLSVAPRRWFESGAWEVDELVRPEDNPWLARTRITGLDFSADGKSLVTCTWDGDVWNVSGLETMGGPKPMLHWRRIACGLFQPLGILWEDERILVSCRDQLVALHDRNDDGEMDHYECFNSDHQVTEHFHEFAMGLQRDAEGSYYYAKSARHALKAVVPQHGTLLRVSSDGSRTDIVANGFRAANGVCLNDDGTFIVTDQEGHWNPKNRINWVHEGGFYGNLFGYHDVTDESDSAMEQPLCWITNDFDRSPAELLWARTDSWGPLNGRLLNLSYGYGRIYVVPHEHVPVVNDESALPAGHQQPQGGMCQLPIPDLPTGMIRGRFSPLDGQLYLGGMYSWAGSRSEQEGGLFRVRYRGGRVDLPVELHALEDGIEITFSDPLDRDTVGQLDRYRVTVWDLKRTADYGSKHFNERQLELSQASLSADGRTVRLTIPDLQPTWGMEIVCRLKGSDGQEFRRVIHNTVHEMKPR